jgi:hypothetical protein
LVIRKDEKNIWFFAFAKTSETHPHQKAQRNPVGIFFRMWEKLHNFRQILVSGKSLFEQGKRLMLVPVTHGNSAKTPAESKLIQVKVNNPRSKLSTLRAPCTARKRGIGETENTRRPDSL